MFDIQNSLFLHCGLKRHLVTSATNTITNTTTDITNKTTTN